MDALQTFGVSNAMEAHDEIIRPLFVGGLKTVNLQDRQELFHFSLSPPVSNHWRVEKQTKIFWKNWLIEVNGMS